MKSSSRSSSELLAKNILVIRGDQVIVTIGDFDRWVETQPLYKEYMHMQPELRSSLARLFVVNQILIEWVKAEGIDTSAEYQKLLAEQYSKEELARLYFERTYISEITPEALKRYYEDIKESCGINIPGGIVMQSARFSTEQEAHDFFEVVKEVTVDFKKAAKDKKVVVKAYKKVRDTSLDVAEPLRTKLLGLTTFPAIVIVKIDGHDWQVAKAFQKEEAHYESFERVKKWGLDQKLKEQNIQKALELDGKELQSICKNLDIKINTEAFDLIGGT